MITIPIYEALITDELQGIFNISLVDDPAVNSNWLAFKNQEKFMSYSIQNEEKRLICGVLMRANYNIYRNDKEIGEFYIRYSPETIRLMAEKMMIDNTHNNINIMHIDGSNVDGVYLTELFIKDTSKGINPKGFEYIEEGSLFATYKVENPYIWDEIKNGTFKGFSLEGMFDITQSKIKQEMSIKTKLMNTIMKFGETNTDKGIIYWSGEEDLKIGDEVFVGEEKNTAEDGDYTTEDGKVIKVVEGKVAEILDTKAEVEPKEEEMEDEEIKEETTETIEEPIKEDNTNEIENLKGEIEALKGTIDEMKAEIEALKNSFNELVNKPAAEPIAEEFNKVEKKDTKKGNAARILAHLHD